MNPLDMEKFLRERGWLYCGAGKWRRREAVVPITYDMESAYAIEKGRKQ